MIAKTVRKTIIRLRCDISLLRHLLVSPASGKNNPSNPNLQSPEIIGKFDIIALGLRGGSSIARADAPPRIKRYHFWHFLGGRQSTTMRSRRYPMLEAQRATSPNGSPIRTIV